VVPILQQDEGAAGAYPVADRMRRLFGEKDLLRTEIYREASLLARILDDMVLRDKVDIFQSQGAYRIISRLCGIELALRPVTSEATLSRANWDAADALELPTDIAANAVGLLARAEARKRLSSRRRLEERVVKLRGPCKCIGPCKCQTDRICFEYRETAASIWENFSSPKMDFTFKLRGIPEILQPKW
jgi:hypothetical protein